MHTSSKAADVEVQLHAFCDHDFHTKVAPSQAWQPKQASVRIKLQEQLPWRSRHATAGTQVAAHPLAPPIACTSGAAVTAASPLLQHTVVLGHITLGKALSRCEGRTAFVAVGGHVCSATGRMYAPTLADQQLCIQVVPGSGLTCWEACLCMRLWRRDCWQPRWTSCKHQHCQRLQTTSVLLLMAVVGTLNPALTCPPWRACRPVTLSQQSCLQCCTDNRTCHVSAAGAKMQQTLTSKGCLLSVAVVNIQSGFVFNVSFNTTGHRMSELYLLSCFANLGSFAMCVLASLGASDCTFVSQTGSGLPSSLLALHQS